MSLQNLMQTINTKMTTICHLIKKGNVRKYNYEDGEYGMFAMRYKMIGLKIAYYRKLCGYTQEQLAVKTGITRTYLSQIECGNKGKSFSLETLFLIADALNIDVNLLLSKTENI